MNNKKFWNERYSTIPEIGSGPGSRGYSAWLKQILMERVLRFNSIRSVLDIGCGDMFWMKDGLLDDVDYIGLDISDVIVKRNRCLFPWMTFAMYDITSSNYTIVKPDLVICLDVLLHQCENDSFRRAYENVVASISRHGLISYPAPVEETDSEQIITDKEMPEYVKEAHDRFNEQDRKMGDLIPRGKTKCFGDLGKIIKQYDPSVQVRVVSSYMGQNVYEVGRCGWLTIKTDEN